MFFICLIFRVNNLLFIFVDKYKLVDGKSKVEMNN